MYGVVLEILPEFVLIPFVRLPKFYLMQVNVVDHGILKMKHFSRQFRRKYKRRLTSLSIFPIYGLFVFGVLHCTVQRGS